MSAKASFWAWDVRGIKSMPHFVLVCLADNHNADTQRCDPSIRYISDKTGMDKKTVRTAIKYLQDHGLIRVKKRPGTSDYYTLLIGEISFSKPTPTKSGTGSKPSTESGRGCGQLSKSGANNKQKGLSLPEHIPKTVLVVTPVPKTDQVPETGTKPKTISLSHNNNLSRGIVESGWLLKDSNREFVKFHRVDLLPDVELIAQMFCLHYKSTGDRYKDWDARFEKWCLHEREKSVY